MSTQEEIEALKEATRAAHEVLKDIKQARRAAEQAKDELLSYVAAALEYGIEDIVKYSLEEYQAVINRHTELATEAVFSRFDQLEAIMLGETRSQRRRNGESIQEMVERIFKHDQSADSGSPTTGA